MFPFLLWDSVHERVIYISFAVLICCNLLGLLVSCVRAILRYIDEAKRMR